MNVMASQVCTPAIGLQSSYQTGLFELDCYVVASIQAIPCLSGRHCLSPWVPGPSIKKVFVSATELHAAIGWRGYDQRTHGAVGKPWQRSCAQDFFLSSTKLVHFHLYELTAQHMLWGKKIWQGCVSFCQAWSQSQDFKPNLIDSISLCVGRQFPFFFDYYWEGWTDLGGHSHVYTHVPFGILYDFLRRQQD